MIYCPSLRAVLLFISVRNVFLILRLLNSPLAPVSLPPVGIVSPPTSFVTPVRVISSTVVSSVAT
jgi:hypothetical protein